MSDAQVPQIIPAEVAGFPGIAHGGYVCGLLASRAPAAPSVSTVFVRPVPTGERLSLEAGSWGSRLVRGEEILAVCKPSPPASLDVPPPLPLVEAEKASAAFPGRHSHLFPGCYCCGTANPSGLHVFPGPVPGRDGLVAAVWRPAGPPGEEMPATMLWASLDCPAIWALMVTAGADDDARVVTGRLETHQLAPVRLGEPMSILAWPAGATPGRRLAAAALYDAQGRVLATMLQTCVEVRGWGVPLSIATWGAAARHA